MLQIETTTHTYNIHTSVDEVTLSQYIDFLKGEVQFQDNVYEGGTGEKELIEALSNLLDIADDLEMSCEDDDKGIFDCSQLSVIILYNHYIDLFNNYLIRWADEILATWETGTDDQKKRLAQIRHAISKAKNIEELHHILLIISEENGNFRYKKGKFSFLHNDKRYYIDPMGFVEEHTRKFTVGEVSQMKESRNRTVKAMDSRNDAKGLLMFELGLRDVSLICRRYREKLPAHPGDRDEFLKARMGDLEDMKMNVYYDVCFFLTHTIIELGCSEIINMLLKTSSMPERKTKQSTKTNTGVLKRRKPSKSKNYSVTTYG